MLTSLRKNQQNIIIKGLMAIIIVSFVIFFGASGLRSENPQQGYLATVNSDPINPVKADFLLRSQLEQFNQTNKMDLPESIINSIRASIVNQLIDQKLISLAMENFGLQATQEELVELIKNHPQFNQDGKFNKDFYTKRFLPYYQAQRGSSFETDMREELSAQKLFSAFEDTLQPTEKELKQLNTIINTKYEFDVVAVENEALAQELWPKWIQNQDLQNTLKDNKLNETKTPALSMTRLRSVFGGQASLENIKALLQLTEKAPFPATLLHEGNNYYLVKLLKKTPATEPDAAALDDLKSAYQNALRNSLEASFVQDLRDHAKIKTSPNLNL